jgi:drug/metabolite transporter (DMT)-like permease
MTRTSGRAYGRRVITLTASGSDRDECCCHGPGVESSAVTHEQTRATVLTEVSLILAAVFWGLNFVVTKYAADFLPPLLVVALRFAAGSLLLLGLLKILGPKSKLARRDILPMLGLGCFGIGAAQTAFTFGVSMTSAASAGLVFATAPVWGILLGLVLGRERPTLRGVLGIGLSILGVGIVFYGGSSGTGGDTLGGNLLALLAAMGIGAYAVFSLPLLDRYSPLMVATYSVLFGALAILLASLPFFVSVRWESVSFGLWAAIAYSAIFATTFAFAGWQRGISRIGANKVLVYQYLITLTAVTAGVLLLGESFGTNKLLGGLIILVGVYLARRQ